MNYSTLTTNIANIYESSFTTAESNMFIQNAEQTIYNAVQIPALRRNQTGVVTTGNRYLVFPTDLLYAFSLAVISSSGDYTYLLNKDTNFMLEAYPNPATTGAPVHYGFFDSTTFIMGPTPDAAYSIELHYGYYPESIVTATNTWLGDNFDTALLNAALVEAARFMKAEPDIISNYENMFAKSLALLKNLGDGKLRQDAYRSGQLRNEVR